MLYTPDLISKLKDNEIFIFGSNVNGNHFGGAAKIAYEKFGAEWGVGEGLINNSYAFPTLDREMNKQTESNIVDSINRLYKTCSENTTKIFLLTKVGCGIAGFNEEYMKNLFVNSPGNLVKPIDWY